MNTQNSKAKKPLCLVFTLLLSLSLGIPCVQAGDPALMGWWKFDGDALDSSGNDRHGTLQGSPTFGPGVFGQALQCEANPDYVTIDGYKGIMGTQAFSIAAWVKTTNTAIGQIMHWGPPVNGERVEFRINGNRLRISHGNGNVQGDTDLTDGEWYHVAVVVIDNASASSGDVTFYVNGQDDTQVKTDPDTWNITVNPTLDLTIGWRPTQQDRPFIGSMDDVVLYSKVLTPEDLENIMSGNILPATGQAGSEAPAHEATDVPHDVILNWSPGLFATTHNVYLGTVFADVNNASTADASGILVSQGQNANSLDVDALTFGQTYYWRVDEVNAAPDKTVYQGEVWSFTVEPMAIDIQPITATASGANPGMEPSKTIDGSGLNDLDQHSVSGTDMWLAAGVEPWIQYEFDQAYKLHEMWVWNSNQMVESFIGFGANEVAIETSTDGTTWTALEGVPALAQGTGLATYVANTRIDFTGVMAKYVKITVVSAYGFSGQTGLSEVRFLAIPTTAREPQPAAGTVIDSANIVLQWRSGREVAEHQVFLGTDASDLSLLGTVTESQIDTGALDYATDYYWSVTEVNQAATPAEHAGEVWSFTTPDYATVDDFESYSGQEGQEVVLAWFDGFGGEASLGGSTTGHIDGPFVETTLVKSGTQSMPIFYANDASFIDIDGKSSTPTFSEVLREFDTPQDWSASGLQTLSLFFHGAAANTPGQLYCKINNSRINYVGLPNALQRPQWIPWNISLSDTGATLSSITSLTLGIEGTGAVGTLYVDNIRLYPLPAETIDPVIPDDSDPNLVAYYEFEGNANDTRGNYHATAEGEPSYSPGKTGQAISLNEIDRHVVHTFAQEEVWPAYSLSLWVKTDLLDQDDFSGLFNNNSSSGSSSSFQIDMDGASPGNYRYHGSVDGSLGPASSNWVHIGVSCNGIQTHLFYNGLFVQSLDVADTNFGQINVGTNRNAVNMFGGMIDELRIYNRALSPAEFAGLAGTTMALHKPF